MTKDKEIVIRDEYIVRPQDNCAQSAVRAMKVGAVIGASTGVVIAQNVLHLSMLELVGRAISRCIFPSVVVTGTFASMTCIMDEVRGLDNPVSNGFIGGAMAGMVLGTRSHNPGRVVMLGFILGVIGAGIRFGAVNRITEDHHKAYYEIVSNNLPIQEIRHTDPFTPSQKN